MCVVYLQMCNLNIIAQLLRVIFGIALIALAWFGPQTKILSHELMYLWNFGWLGIIPLVSGIAAFCPIYAILGLGHKTDKKP